MKHVHEWQPLFLPPVTPEQKRDAYWSGHALSCLFICECGAIAYRTRYDRRRNLYRFAVQNSECNSTIDVKVRAENWNTAVRAAQEGTTHDKQTPQH